MEVYADVIWNDGLTYMYVCPKLTVVIQLYAGMQYLTTMFYEETEYSTK